MQKNTLILTGVFSFSLIFLAAPRAQPGGSPGPAHQLKNAQTATGTLQKLIVETGAVTMQLDLNALSFKSSPDSLVARPVALQFAAGANSFFPILVYNDLLRGPLPGSISLLLKPGKCAALAPGLFEPSCH